MSNFPPPPVAPIHVERFHAEQVTFAELRDAYPKCSLSELALAVGIPMPEQVISVRHVDEESWPYEDHYRIFQTRIAYDEGVVEMATGRFAKRYFVLYVFPRKKRALPRRYFFESRGVG